MKKNKLSLFDFLSIVGLSILACVFLAACGDKNDKGAGGATEETKGIAITDKEVAGVSQKGPFLTGSTVHLYELNGIDFIQTGKSFAGKTNSDKGDFSISKINLKSQYALLEAHGYYRNEVTGQKSASQITLNAVTDLEDRDHVNINLLTHLAYERIRKLVKTDEDVVAVKKRAETEIFLSFYVTGEFDQFEDMDMFNGGEGDAALLAISILMQGARSEAELSELLALYANDVAVDGAWDDEVQKAEIADWAESVCLKDRFANIRKNVEGWGFGRVPAFEKYAMRFWWYNYGLGLCGEKRQGEIKRNWNRFSANVGINYICEDEFWHRLDESVSSVESSSSVSESSDSEAESSSSNVESESSSSEIVGSSSSTASSSSNQVSSSSEEQSLSSAESSSSVEQSSSSRISSSSVVPSSSSVISSSSVESSSSSVVSSSSVESSSSDVYSGDISTWPVAEDGTVISISSETYVYDESDGWRKATTKFDLPLGEGCTLKNDLMKKKMYDETLARDVTYLCYAKGWNSSGWNWYFPKEVYFNENVNYGTMIDPRDGHVYKTTVIGTQTWMAENLNYYDEEKMPSLKRSSWCYNNVASNCNIAGRLYSWSAAVDSVFLDETYGIQCGADATCTLKGVVEFPLQGVCPEGWHLPTKEEFSIMGKAMSGSTSNMKSNFGWVVDGKDEFGLTLLPAGHRSSDVGLFYGEGYFAYFWTSTGREGGYVPTHCYLKGTGSLQCPGNRPAFDGMSVRCVKD